MTEAVTDTQTVELEVEAKATAVVAASRTRSIRMEIPLGTDLPIVVAHRALVGRIVELTLFTPNGSEIVSRGLVECLFVYKDYFPLDLDAWDWEGSPHDLLALDGQTLKLRLRSIAPEATPA